MKNGELRSYYIFSPFLRIFHWTMVLSIIILFFTGLYIGNPFYYGGVGEPTFAVASLVSMETIRYIHFGAAYIFMAAFILRLYGWIVNRGDRLLPKFWTKKFTLDSIEVAMHYLFLKPHHKPYLRNPMARGGYAALYGMVAIEAITGWAMYVMINPHSFGATLFGRFNGWLGGEYYVHLIHHYVAWFIILFAIIHVYMAVRADYMEKGGEISSMFSGYKFFREEPDDIGDIR